MSLLSTILTNPSALKNLAVKGSASLKQVFGSVDPLEASSQDRAKQTYVDLLKFFPNGTESLVDMEAKRRAEAELKAKQTVTKFKPIGNFAFLTPTPEVPKEVTPEDIARKREEIIKNGGGQSLLDEKLKAFEPKERGIFASLKTEFERMRDKKNKVNHELEDLYYEYQKNVIEPVAQLQKDMQESTIGMSEVVSKLNELGLPKKYGITLLDTDDEETKRAKANDVIQRIGNEAAEIQAKMASDYTLDNKLFALDDGYNRQVSKKLASSKLNNWNPLYIQEVVGESGEKIPVTFDLTRSIAENNQKKFVGWYNELASASQGNIADAEKQSINTVFNFLEAQTDAFYRLEKEAKEQAGATNAIDTLAYAKKKYPGKEGFDLTSAVINDYVEGGAKKYISQLKQIGRDEAVLIGAGSILSAINPILEKYKKGEDITVGDRFRSGLNLVTGTSNFFGKLLEYGYDVAEEEYSGNAQKYDLDALSFYSSRLDGASSILKEIEYKNDDSNWFVNALQFTDAAVTNQGGVRGLIGGTIELAGSAILATRMLNLGAGGIQAASSSKYTDLALKALKLRQAGARIAPGTSFAQAVPQMVYRGMVDGIVIMDTLEKIMGDESGLTPAKLAENTIFNLVFSSLHVFRGLKDVAIQKKVVPLVEEYMTKLNMGDDIAQEVLKNQEEFFRANGINITDAALRQMANRGLVNASRLVARGYHDLFESLAHQSEKVRSAVLDNLFLLDPGLKNLSGHVSESLAKKEAKEQVFQVMRKKVDSFLKKTEKSPEGISDEDVKGIFPVIVQAVNAFYDPVEIFRKFKIPQLARLFKNSTPDEAIKLSDEAAQQMLEIVKPDNDRREIIEQLTLMRGGAQKEEVQKVMDEISEITVGKMEQMTDDEAAQINELLKRKIAEANLPPPEGSAGAFKPIEDVYDVEKGVFKIPLNSTNPRILSEIPRGAFDQIKNEADRARLLFMKDVDDASKKLSAQEIFFPDPSPAEISDFLKSPALERIITSKDADEIGEFVSLYAKGTGRSPWTVVRQTLFGRMTEDIISPEAMRKAAGELVKYNLRNFIKSVNYDTAIKLNSSAQKGRFLEVLEKAQKSTPIQASRLMKLLEAPEALLEELPKSKNARADEIRYLSARTSELAREMRLKRLRSEDVTETHDTLKSVLEKHMALQKEGALENLNAMENALKSMDRTRDADGIFSAIDDFRSGARPSKFDAGTHPFSTQKEMHDLISDDPAFLGSAREASEKWKDVPLDEPETLTGDIMGGVTDEIRPTKHLEEMSYEQYRELSPDEKRGAIKEVFSRYTDGNLTEDDITDVMRTRSVAGFLKRSTEMITRRNMENWGQKITEVFEDNPEIGMGAFGKWDESSSINQIMQDFLEQEARETSPTWAPFFTPWENILNRSSEGADIVRNMNRLRVSMANNFSFAPRFRRAAELLRKSGFHLNENAHLNGWQDLIDRMRYLREHPEELHLLATEYGITARAEATQIYQVAAKETRFRLVNPRTKSKVPLSGLETAQKAKILDALDTVLNVLNRTDDSVKILTGQKFSLVRRGGAGEKTQGYWNIPKFLDSVINANAQNAVLEKAGGLPILTKLIGEKSALRIIEDVSKYRKRWSELGLWEKVDQTFMFLRGTITFPFSVVKQFGMIFQDIMGRYRPSRAGFEATNRFVSLLDSQKNTAEKYFLLKDLDAYLPKVDNVFEARLVEVRSLTEFDYISSIFDQGMLGGIKKAYGKTVGVLRNVNRKAQRVLTAGLDTTTNRYAMNFTVDLWDLYLQRTVFRNVEGLYEALKGTGDDVLRKLANETFTVLNTKVRSTVTNIIGLDHGNPLFKNVWDRWIFTNFMRKWMGRIQGTFNNSFAKYGSRAGTMMAQGKPIEALRTMAEGFLDPEVSRILSEAFYVTGMNARLYERGEDNFFEGMSPYALFNLSTMGMLVEAMPHSGAVRKIVEDLEWADEYNIDPEQSFQIWAYNAVNKAFGGVASELSIYSKALAHAFGIKEKFPDTTATEMFRKFLRESLFFFIPATQPQEEKLQDQLASPQVKFLSWVAMTREVNAFNRRYEYLKNVIFTSQLAKGGQDEEGGGTSKALFFWSALIANDPSRTARSFNAYRGDFDKKASEYLETPEGKADLALLYNGKLNPDSYSAEIAWKYFTQNGSWFFNQNEAVNLAVANSFPMTNEMKKVFGNISEMQQGEKVINEVLGVVERSGEGALSGEFKSEVEKMKDLWRDEYIKDLDFSDEHIGEASLFLRFTIDKQKKALTKEVRKMNDARDGVNSILPDQEAAIAKLLYDIYAEPLAIVDRKFRVHMLTEKLARATGYGLPEDKSPPANDPAILRAEALLESALVEKNHGIFENKANITDFSWLLRSTAAKLPDNPKAIDRFMIGTLGVMDSINTSEVPLHIKKGLADSMVMGLWDTASKWMKSLDGRILSIQNAQNIANVAKIFYDSADEDLSELYEDFGGGGGGGGTVNFEQIKNLKKQAGDTVRALKDKFPEIVLSQYNPVKVNAIKPTKRFIDRIKQSLEQPEFTLPPLSFIKSRGVVTAPIRTPAPSAKIGKPVTRRIAKPRVKAPK